MDELGYSLEVLPLFVPNSGLDVEQRLRFYWSQTLGVGLMEPRDAMR